MTRHEEDDIIALAVATVAAGGAAFVSALYAAYGAGVFFGAMAVLALLQLVRKLRRAE